jgi:hypothetical protein
LLLLQSHRRCLAQDHSGVSVQSHLSAHHWQDLHLPPHHHYQMDCQHWLLLGLHRLSLLSVAGLKQCYQSHRYSQLLLLQVHCLGPHHHLQHQANFLLLLYSLVC